MEHADLGRITVGRWEAAGVLGTIDLTGHMFLPASASFILLNGRLLHPRSFGSGLRDELGQHWRSGVEQPGPHRARAL